MPKIILVVALTIFGGFVAASSTEHERLALCDVLTGVGVLDGAVVLSSARSTVLRSERLALSAMSSGNACSGAIESPWKTVNVPVDVAWTKVVANDRGLWLLGHKGVVLNSRDLGASWHSVMFSGSPQQAVMNLLSPTRVEAGINSNRMYAVGTRGFYAVSQDKGANWQQQTLYIDPEWEEPEDFNLNAMVQLQAGGYLVAGEAGAVYWSADGEQWEKDFAGTEATWFGAVAMPSGGVLLYGFGGELAYAEGYKEDWVKLGAEAPSSSLFSSMLLESGELLLAGQHGVLLRWSGRLEQPFLPVKTAINATITDMALFDDKLLMATDHGLWSVPYSLVQSAD